MVARATGKSNAWRRASEGPSDEEVSSQKDRSQKDYQKEVMPSKDVCEIAGCEKSASRMTTTESKYIMICDDCWHQKYKK